MASNSKEESDPSVLWDDVRGQKKRGQYPWTHLHHDEEGEVWIDPLSLPKDKIPEITSKEMPREWFHLPEGSRPPTVDELLKDSSSSEENNNTDEDKKRSLRTKTPICGRNRSKSRGKEFLVFNETEEEGYEPIGRPLGEKSKCSFPPLFPKVLNISPPLPPPHLPPYHPPSSGLQLENIKLDENDGYEPIGASFPKESVITKLSKKAQIDSLRIPKDESHIEIEESFWKDKNEFPSSSVMYSQTKEQDQTLEKEREEKKERKKNKEDKKINNEKNKNEENEEKRKRKQEKNSKNSKEGNKDKDRKQKKSFLKGFLYSKAKSMSDLKGENKEESHYREIRKHSSSNEVTLEEKNEKIMTSTICNTQLNGNDLEFDVLPSLEINSTRELVKNDSFDDFVHYCHDRPSYVNDEEEEIDFTPQSNSMKTFHEDVQTEKCKSKSEKEKFKRGFQNSLSNFNCKLRNVRRSNQPLLYRSKIEEMDCQKAKSLMETQKSPGELGALKTFFDFPIPKHGGKSNRHKMEKTEKSKLVESTQGVQSEPRSWKNLTLVTNTKENEDPQVLKDRRALVQHNTPGELAELHSFSEFPIPSKITNIFKSSNEVSKKRNLSKEKDAQGNSLFESFKETKLITNTRDILEEEKDRRAIVTHNTPSELSQIHSLGDFPVPSKIENIFKPKRTRSSSLKSKEKIILRSQSVPSDFVKRSTSWRETTLLRVNRRDEDQETVSKRKALTELKTPKELSVISSLGDFPIPSGLAKPFKPQRKKSFEDTVDNNVKRINLEDIYSSLPLSLKQELLVSSKVSDDSDLIQIRQKLIEMKNPIELAKFQSLSDFPIPTPIQKIFKDKGSSKYVIEKRKRNKTALGLKFTYEGLPQSLKTELLVRTDLSEESALMQSRQELVKSKTPGELAVISNFSDFPLPENIERIYKSSKRQFKSSIDKDDLKKKSRSWANLTNPKELYDSLPQSLKSELLVNVKIENEDVQKKRQETIQNKSVSDLSAIHSLSEFPIPSSLEKIIANTAMEYKKKKGSSSKTLKESLIPNSLKSELLVRVEIDDEKIVKQRQEIIRCKSPSELSQVHSLSDFPIPDTIENIFKRSVTPLDMSPIPPLRRIKKENIIENLPSSLKTELLVRSKILEDESLSKARQDLIRSKSPSQLAVIHGLRDFPIPDCIEKTLRRNEEHKVTEKPTAFNLYESLPDSLKKECRVRSKVESEALQRERAEIVKSKSVNELSQFSSLNDFPVPESIEKFISRLPRPVERRKKFREMTRSQSAKNLRENIGVPLFLKNELLVISKFENPEVQEQRRRIVSSTSVGQLSQITSFSDFPLPSKIERLWSKNQKNTGTTSLKTSLSNVSISKSFYESLPKSLTVQDCLVRTRMEDPHVITLRKNIVESKSVSELAKMSSVSDFPVPSSIEKFVKKRSKSLIEYRKPRNVSSTDEENKDTYSSTLYASIPKSLKTELFVRSLTEDPSLLKERQNLLKSKSIGELSQIHSLSDLPVPQTLLNILKTRPKSPSFSLYESLPASLKQEILVRSTFEENVDKVKSHQNLIESQTPTKLSEIHSFSEIPLPEKLEYWLHYNTLSSSTDGNKRNQETDHFEDNSSSQKLTVKSMIPTSLVRPCIVRSLVEPHERLLERQALQQTKSIHELAKIKNLNEFPLPGSFHFPNIPFPSTKDFRRLWSSSKKEKTESRKDETSNSLWNDVSLLTDDDEQLRYESSTPGASITHDFDYEIIFTETENNQEKEKSEEEKSEENVICLGGTPPKTCSRSKRKRNRQPFKQENDLIPPPLPFKTGKGFTNFQGDSENSRDLTSLPVKASLTLESKEGQLKVLKSEVTPQEIEYTEFIKEKEERGDEDSLEERLRSLLYVPVPRQRQRKRISLDKTPSVPFRSLRSISSRKLRQDQSKESSLEKKETLDWSRIQSRPLPAPPTPLRSLRSSHKSIRPSKNSSEASEQLTTFQTCKSGSTVFYSDESRLELEKRRKNGFKSYDLDDDDDTLADSVVDSMYSCAETLVDEERTLHEDLKSLQDEYPQSDENNTRPTSRMSYKQGGNHEGN